MSKENINLERVRKTWIAMGKLPEMPEGDRMNPQDLNRKRTSLDMLRRRYTFFWVMSLIMAFVSFMMWTRGTLIDSQLKLYVGIAYALYFLTTFAIDKWLSAGIGKIDPLTMGISQLAKKSLFYRKRHLQFMAILIPMALALLGFTAYALSSDTAMIAGIITGAVIGGILGVIQFRRFMAAYNQLAE